MISGRCQLQGQSEKGSEWSAVFAEDQLGGVYLHDLGNRWSGHGLGKSENKHYSTVPFAASKQTSTVLTSRETFEGGRAGE